VKELEGRVAVITGGASGIGLGLAHRFAAEGMKLVIGDVETAALDDAVATLRGKGAEVLGVVTDVADPDQVQALADAAVSRFGGVHVCCNNAGVGTGGLSWEIPRATWEWVLGVNLWGVIHGIRTFVPLLVQQPEAHVVNTASIAGLVAAPFMGPYNASKHAVVAISETLHHELAMHAPHVKVSVVCPGWVRTKIADSERNRPPHLRVDDTAATLEAAGAEMLRGFLEQGMSPDLVAGKVVTALREDRFWVLTHDDESDFWVGSVQRRLHSLERRANPELSLPF
jgi:NAD(P)-dependent dehydrogenase (short-subunit alcohol dehydrogenase family)